MGRIEEGIRELRVAEVGAEQAELERIRGSKTDEEYAKEAAARRKEREDRRLEQEQTREEERIKIEAAEIARREKEIAERRAEKEARRAKEREVRQAIDRARDSDPRTRESDLLRDHRRYGSDNRGRDRDSGRDDYRRRDRRVDDYKDSPRVRSLEKPLSREETKRLEEEALAELLRDGKKVMQKSRYQAEPEIDETLAPPPRKTMPASAIMPIDRDSPAKLEKKDSRSRLDDTASLTGSIRSARNSTEKLDDRDKRTSRLRSRSRDRYSRRSSKDRDYRSRRSSRDRRKSRSRERPRDTDRERDRERDSRRRDDLDRVRGDSYDRRGGRDSRKDSSIVPRSDYRDSRPDSRSRLPERESFRSGSGSRLPERGPPERDSRRMESRSRLSEVAVEKQFGPAVVIDVDKDPVLSTLVGMIEGTTHTTRRWVNPAEEEQKLRDIKAREAEARAFAAKREEAMAKGLPLPGWERPPDNRPRLGSGSVSGGNFARPNWRSHGGGPIRDDSRKRDVETADFATPGPREKKFDERPRDRESSSRHSIEPSSSVTHLRKESIVSASSNLPSGLPRESRFDQRRESVLSTKSASVTNVPREQREDSHEAGEIVPGRESDPIRSTPVREPPLDIIRKRSRSRDRSDRDRDRDRRRDDRDRERPRSRERERERERDGKRDDRRDDRGTDRRDDRRSERKDERDRSYRSDRRDDRGAERRDDRKPRSRSRERDRRYRSRSRDRAERRRHTREGLGSFRDRRR